MNLGLTPIHSFHYCARPAFSGEKLRLISEKAEMVKGCYSSNKRFRIFAIDYEIRIKSEADGPVQSMF
jgi:hypothetical protein